MTTEPTRTRLLIGATATLGLGAAIAITAPASAAPDSDAFCDAAAMVEESFVTAPLFDDLDEAGQYFDEHIAPLVDALSAATPDDLTGAVDTLMDTYTEVFTTDDFERFFSDEFIAASAEVYPALADACEFPVIDVALTDYAFGGIPATIPSGTTLFLVHNESETDELHELILFKLVDGVEMTAAEWLDVPDEEAEEMIDWVNGAIVVPDEISGMFAELTPGNYVYYCFIPVGSVHGEEGDGPPHFVEGMLGEFTVED